MQHPSRLLSALWLVALITPAETNAANTYSVNPFGLAYTNTANVSQYAHPGGMLIAHVCDMSSSAFTSARANGAELLVYLNPVEVPDSPLCDLSDAFYNDNGAAPLWPYPSYGQRLNFPYNHLTDLRAGSAWSSKVVAYIEKLMREDKVDGVFLDVLGGRLWTSLADWDSWPQWEKDAWTDGAVDLARRIDARRRALNPRFIVVSNGVWSRGIDTRGDAGEKYVDGVCLEHHLSTSAYHRAYVGRAFGNLGHRRVLIIGKGTAEAQAWAGVQGVTNVSDQATYVSVTPPPIAFTRLVDRPKRFGRSSRGTDFSSGLVSDYRRGSRFALMQTGRLLNMGAYVDGNGGPLGTQNLRMVLYKDSSGKPGALVAQSNSMAIKSGDTARWLYFPSPQVALDPGTYWIMIHSGSTNAVTRIAGDGSPNWLGTVDAFADGAANPGGAGVLGSITLSLFANYTVGY